MSNLQPRDSRVFRTTQSQILASTPIHAGQGQHEMYNENPRTSSDLGFQGTGQGWALNGAGLPLSPPIAKEFPSLSLHVKQQLYINHHSQQLSEDYVLPHNFDPESIDTPLPPSAAREPASRLITQEVASTAPYYALPPIIQTSRNANFVVPAPYYISQPTNKHIRPNVPFQSELPHHSLSARVGYGSDGYGSIPMERSYPSQGMSIADVSMTLNNLSLNAQIPPSYLPGLEPCQFSTPGPVGFDSRRLGGYEMQRSLARRDDSGGREPHFGHHARQPVGYTANNSTALLTQRETTNVPQAPRHPETFDPVRSCMPPPDPRQSHQ